MPMYEYACEDCHKVFETLVRQGETVECPQCHGVHLHKQFSVPGAPQTKNGGLPLGCDASLPPCGPGCCRS